MSEWIGCLAGDCCNQATTQRRIQNAYVLTDSGVHDADLEPIYEWVCDEHRHD